MTEEAGTVFIPEFGANGTLIRTGRGDGDSDDVKRRSRNLIPEKPLSPDSLRRAPTTTAAAGSCAHGVSESSACRCCLVRTGVEAAAVSRSLQILFRCLSGKPLRDLGHESLQGGTICEPATAAAYFPRPSLGPAAHVARSLLEVSL